MTFYTERMEERRRWRRGCPAFHAHGTRRRHRDYQGVFETRARTASSVSTLTYRLKRG